MSAGAVAEAGELKPPDGAAAALPRGDEAEESTEEGDSEEGDPEAAVEGGAVPQARDQAATKDAAVAQAGAGPVSKGGDAADGGPTGEADRRGATDPEQPEAADADSDEEEGSAGEAAAGASEAAAGASEGGGLQERLTGLVNLTDAAGGLSADEEEGADSSLVGGDPKPAGQSDRESAVQSGPVETEKVGEPAAAKVDGDAGGAVAADSATDAEAEADM